MKQKPVLNPREVMERVAATPPPAKYNAGDLVTIYRRGWDGMGPIQAETMRVVGRNFNHYQKGVWQYYLENPESPGEGNYYAPGIGKYSQVLEESFVYPQRELFDFEPSQQAPRYQVYMAPKDMKPKTVNPREAMDHFAAYPPTKIGPPKDHFPGDTVPNDDGHGATSFAGGEPFGRGLEAPPGARGELVPGRPPGSIGVPMNPISPSQSVDDTERRKQIPPIYRASNCFHFTAEIEEPPVKTGEIPPAILAAWNKAHDAMQDLYPEYSLEQLDRVLEATATFAARSKPYLPEQMVVTLGQRFRDLDESLLSSGGNLSPMARETFAGKVDHVLQMVHNAVSKALKIHQMNWYDKRGAEQGGVFDTHEPSSIGEITPKVRYQCASEKTAFDISPIPKAKGDPKTNEPMVLSLPRDVRERYAALARRVQDYTQSVGPHLGSLDAYKYRSSPPRDWVERELPNAKADWDDLHAWGKYISRKDHHELSNWALKEADFSKVSPTLYTQWAVSSSTQQDFGKWFRRMKPSIRKDESLVTYLRDHARSDPEHEYSRGYDSWWRKRYLGKVYGQAYKLAKEKWTEYLKTSGTEFAKEEYRDALGLVQKAANGERVPVGDLVAALHALPFENEYRADVENYKTELETIVNDGRTALDVARQPVSREDRLFGDLVHEGSRWVPVRRVEGVDAAQGPTSHTGPIRLFAYGSRYFPIDEATEQRVATELALGSMYLEADITRIVPGSSIAKQHVASIEDFNVKSKALSDTIHDIQGGQEREAVLLKYGRVFGPGLRKAVDDYFYIQSNLQREADESDNSGGGGCDTFWEGQTADNCEGCTFNVGTGGPEFGYGGCWLSNLFLNAPDAGFGKGDQPVGYDPGHTPGTPTVEKRPTNYRLHRS